MPRRGENIYRRKDGRWEGRIPKSTEGGKRKYRSVYGKSYHEVKEKMITVRRNVQVGPQNDLTFAQMSELWMKSQSAYWKAGTRSAYRQMLNKYIIPCIGDMPVRQVTNRTLLSVTEKVGRQDGSLLSRNYMFQICSMVRRIMIYANRQFDSGLVIPENPVSKEQVHNTMLPSETALAVLENYLYANSHDDTCLGVMVALHTGIRVGELSALQWKDIDLEEGSLYIRQTILRVRDESGQEDPKAVTRIVMQMPKSSDSSRVIPLPPGLLAVLRQHKKEKTEYVVSGVKAAWAEPRTIQYRFKNILKECGIEYFNFHLLRHTFATRCVSMGLDVKSLSEILGHSSIQLTLNLYVHSTIQQKRQLMQQYDAGLH